MIPSPLVCVVLALAAYRVARLIGWDDLPPILRARAWLVGENRAGRGVPLYTDGVLYERPLLAKFLHCPFCQGWWVSVAVYVAWLEEPLWTLYVLAPFALSAVVGLVAKNWDP